MQRLRTTFKRSRTPTGAEMKTQSSLEAPKQIRSASFDEIQLDAKRAQQGKTLRPEAASSSLLKVPQSGQQRSKSFDSTGQREEPGTFLEVPTKKYQRRRSSGDKVIPPCVHCILVDDYNKKMNKAKAEDSALRTLSYSDSSSSNEWLTEEEECEEAPSVSASPKCCITVTLSPTSPGTPVLELPIEEPISPSGRRRSITRQEAFVFNENMTEITVIPAPENSDVIVSQFFLAVPELKRDRAASVDSCFLNKSTSGKAEEVVPQPSGELLAPPVQGPAGLRSRSVDIVLPTDQQARYKALAMNNNSTQGKAVAATSGEGTSTQKPSIQTTPAWDGTAIEGEHLWASLAPSGEVCYIEADCTRNGQKLKCSACKIVCHTGCIPILMDKLKFLCKPTFRDVGLRSYREKTSTKHHWVHRRTQKGKCNQCSKSFQSKLSFASKDIIALSCSWCKTAYHNRESCFNEQKISEDCDLGLHSRIIVPPSWIVKLPRKGSFKSSLRKSPKKRSPSKKRLKERSEKDSLKKEKSFAIKPIPSLTIQPVIVFINPKSGGNQGATLLQKFQSTLNPRQVFDLTQGGPKMGLQMFRKVPNLRVLACGGDGTVGWVLSIIDQLTFSPQPPVGVLPLGTGNDLARALGWGGGYTDEPISKILANISESEVVQLDRWELKVEKNNDAVSNNEDGKDNLPLNVVNNYFSLGVDAHIALEFHEAREAHPERFNSRLRNKMFYGQMGGKDLLKRKWKGLADFVTLECDGKDYTFKLKEHKVHAIVFLNIHSYGGGTRPWPRTSGTEQSTEDGLIEVVGLTTYQLPFLQAGGHGTPICQCKTAKIVTSKPIPMQVDGEACKLNPSVICMSLLNKAPMLAKRKSGKAPVTQNVLEPMKISVQRINMCDYEQHHYNKDLLKQSAINIGELEVTPVVDLEHVRQLINNLKIPNENVEGLDAPPLSLDWCFVDSCTAERFFRIDRAQEHLHYLMDISSDALYILNSMTTPDETANPTPSSGNSNQHSFSSSTEMAIGLSPTQETLKDHSLDDLFERVAESVQISESQPASTSTIDEPNYMSNLLEKTTDSIVIAAKEGDIKLLKDLHRQGYSLLSIDSTGQTALHYGARYGHKEIVKYLIASAPQSIMNMADNEKGQTALHKAANYKHRSICCMLVAGGTSLTLLDFHGNTAKLLALQANDRQLATYLETQEQFNLAVEDLGTTV